MQFTRLAVTVAAVVGAAVLSVAGSLGPRVPLADASPITPCASHDATIAVDFAHWGGPVLRGCAAAGMTAYRALQAAGFGTAGDDHDGPAFICRLGDAAFHAGAEYPTGAQDNCVETPSATAYWSSWLAAAHSGRWQYSQLGAMSEIARPGEVLLWSFGATNIAGTAGSGLPTMAPAQLRDDASGTSVGNGGPRLVDALPTSQRTSSGSAVGLVIGICAAFALCAGAGWATWRRRQLR